MSDVLNALEARIRAGETISWDDAVVIFENTVIGKMVLAHNYLTREQLVATLKERFENEEALSESMRRVTDLIDAHAGRLH
jgi:hypothetical protein